ncbi:MAG TPA: alpha/beta fold hydrolase [Chryseolinea sp.]|nr:alpha/beta fold hydrolase [Chryseolinea sp.]
MRNLILTLISSFAFSFCVNAQLLNALPRHAYWGASFTQVQTPVAGVSISATVPSGFAETIDLKKGDIITKVNGVEIKTRSRYYEVFYSTKYIKGGTEMTLDVIRSGKALTKKGLIPARPLESFKGIVTEYRSIKSPSGYNVQVIVTRPENTRGKIPGIFFVRWMSCDPIEKPVSRKHGAARMLEDFILKSGYAVIRVEKPGFGDSEGPCCYDADFNEELAAHREAYKVFRSLDYIDPEKIIVFGHSNGAAYAPLVAGEHKPAAYVVSGGWTKTWYEHMLEYSRRDLQLSDVGPAEVTRRMKLISEFYTDYLIHKKLPGDILRQKPQLKEAWSDEPDHQWDLPAAYVQQLQDLNISEAWSKVKSPTYVFYGEYDAAMVEDDHKSIAGLVIKNGGQATYEFVPKMDHSLFWFENQHDALTDFYGKGLYKDELAQKLINWMKTIVE